MTVRSRIETDAQDGGEDNQWNETLGSVPLQSARSWRNFKGLIDETAGVNEKAVGGG